MKNFDKEPVIDITAANMEECLIMRQQIINILKSNKDFLCILIKPIDIKNSESIILKQYVTVSLTEFHKIAVRESIRGEEKQIFEKALK